MKRPRIVDSINDLERLFPQSFKTEKSEALILRILLILPESGKPAEDSYLYVTMKIKEDPLKSRSTFRDTGLTSMPLIVPPVKQKSYDLFGTFFKKLWT